MSAIVRASLAVRIKIVPVHGSGTWATWAPWALGDDLSCYFEVAMDPERACMKSF